MPSVSSQRNNSKDYFSSLYNGFLKALPANLALLHNSSSILKIWLYFAKRSDLQGAPVLIWPVERPTTRSAMKVSSVSPDLWDTIVPQPLDFAKR